MSDQNLELRVHSSPWWAGLQCLVLGGGPGGRTHGESVVMVEHKDFEVIDPTFHLDQRHAQVLMDDLWRCGVRPSDGEGSAGQLASVKYHLEDMRRLVFKMK